MDFNTLQNEIKIKCLQLIEKADRIGTLEYLKKNKSQLEAAALRVDCWICMDKQLVWGHRGFMANIDGKGTHNMLLCGRCQPDAGGEHKQNHCRDWSFIEGGRYCYENDNTSNEQESSKRINILAERA